VHLVISSVCAENNKIVVRVRRTCCQSDNRVVDAVNNAYKM